RTTIIEGIARRGFFPGDLPYGFDGFAHADDGNARDRRRIELLELIQLSWAGTVGDGDQGRQRQQFTLGILYIVVAQPVGIVAVGSLDLGDDLVAAAFDSETVDFRFTQ